MSKLHLAFAFISRFTTNNLGLTDDERSLIALRDLASAVIGNQELEAAIKREKAMAFASHALGEHEWRGVHLAIAEALEGLR